MDLDHNLLLGKLAEDYYLSKMSINDISKKYNLSRYLIMKYLDEAIDKQIVTINIHSGLDRNPELERRLHQEFATKNLYVIKETDNTSTQEKIISSFAATQIQAAIKPGTTIGITWGETVADVITEFKQSVQPDITFTQFTGENMKYRSQAGSMRMVQNAAAKYNAPYYIIPAPLYIVDQQVRQQLVNEPAMERVFNVANQMDLIVCGLGTLPSIDSIQPWRDHKEQIFPQVDLDQIAGMAYGRPFDINGNFLNLTNDTTFSIPLGTILQVPRRFGIIKRKSKYKAALGALRGGLFTDVVITESIALLICHELEKQA